MLKLAVLAVVFCYARAAWYEESAARFTGDQGNWVAGYNKFFRGFTFDQAKALMGTRLGTKPGTPIKTYDEADILSIPSSFNSRNKWTACAPTFDYIKDQAACGSCWAVSASNVVAARTCIANMGSLGVGLNEPAPPIDMSAEQILSCCDWCGDGCQGGYPIDAMRYWCWNGVVTGGWYGSNCGCYPYGVPPCPNGCQEGPTPACHKSCRQGYPRSFSNDKHYCTDHYQIGASVSQLQTEIMTNGPIECAFTVYENFMSYKSGVYDRAEGRVLGGHAVTNYGWGTLNGVPYWIFHNSWNVTWGMQGKFYFKRGGDLCGMESQCVAGKAKTGDSNFMLQC